MGVGGGGEITCWRNGEERGYGFFFPLPNWRGESQGMVGDEEGKINPNQQILNNLNVFIRGMPFKSRH